MNRANFSSWCWMLTLCCQFYSGSEVWSSSAGKSLLFHSEIIFCLKQWHVNKITMIGLFIWWHDQSCVLVCVCVSVLVCLSRFQHWPYSYTLSSNTITFTSTPSVNPVLPVWIHSDSAIWISKLTKPGNVCVNCGFNFMVHRRSILHI